VIFLQVPSFHAITAPAASEMNLTGYSVGLSKILRNGIPNFSCAMVFAHICKSAFSGAGMSFLLFLILQTFLLAPTGLNKILA
jgi:hypothetical protein